MVQLDNNKIYAINNVGVTLRIKLKEPLTESEASGDIKIHWRNPLGDISVDTDELDNTWEGNVETGRQYIYYVLKEGDIITPGIWNLYILVETDTIRLRGNTIELMVYDAFD